MVNLAALQSTPRCHTASHRVSQVYVEIPPSPYSHVRDASKPHVSVTSVSLKENMAPLQSTVMQRDTSEKANDASPSVLKRKMSTLALVVNNQKKKPKLSGPKDVASKSTSTGKMARPKANAQKSQSNDTSEEFPDGSFNCHHCHAKHEPSAGIQCTVNTGLGEGRKERRCKATFCKKCLKHRYSENFDTILTKGQSPSSRLTIHVKDAPYIFQCPRCRGICNCYRCQKGPAQKRGKLKVLPSPKWRPIDAGLSLLNAEARIQVREFVIRFRTSMQTISESHLQELGQLVGRDRWTTENGEDEAEEEWVSESCIKAVILGLLEVIAEDKIGETAKIINDAIKDLRRCSTRLERVWGILSSLRDSLSTSSISAETSSPRDLPLTFPDPYAPATSYTARTTRSGAKEALQITHSGQMLPVLVTLTDLAIQTKQIRDHLEVAGSNAREWAKEERDAHKRENDSWDMERKSLLSSVSHKYTDDERVAKIKARTALRNKVFHNLDCALKILLSDCTLRVGPLGRDTDGRIYWAMSPGLVEREIALRVLISGGQESDYCRGKKSNRGKNKTRKPEDRMSMTDWTWFIAVWGRRPETESHLMDAKESKDLKDAANSNEDEIDDGEERWWGFCEPEEIKKLAAWITRHEETQEETLLDTKSPSDHRSKTAAHDELGPSTKDEVKSLVHALDNYAEVLQWLIEQEENENDNCLDASVAPTEKRRGRPPKVAAVPATNFYA